MAHYYERLAIEIGKVDFYEKVVDSSIKFENQVIFQILSNNITRKSGKLFLVYLEKERILLLAELLIFIYASQFLEQCQILVWMRVSLGGFPVIAKITCCHTFTKEINHVRARNQYFNENFYCKNCLQVFSYPLDQSQLSA